MINADLQSEFMFEMIDIGPDGCDPVRIECFLDVSSFFTAKVWWGQENGIALLTQLECPSYRIASETDLARG